MKQLVDLMRYTRRNILALVGEVSMAQLTYIPPGFRNNLIWNLGHIIYTQQRMCYQLGGLRPTIDVDYYQTFASGTLPDVVRSEAEAAMIKKQFLAVLDDFEADLNRGLFVNYQPWSLHDQLAVQNINDAMAVSAVHEGRHYGVITSLHKLYP